MSGAVSLGRGVASDAAPIACGHCGQPVRSRYEGLSLRTHRFGACECSCSELRRRPHVVADAEVELLGARRPASSPLMAQEVSDLCLRLRTAASWAELLSLGQRIWDYPVADAALAQRGVHAPRVRLCAAYAAGVEQLWLRPSVRARIRAGRVAA